MEITKMIDYLKFLEKEYGSDLDVWVRGGDKESKVEDYVYGRVVSICHCKDGRPILEARPPLFK